VASDATVDLKGEGDVLLAQKLALETMEMRALEVANKYRVGKGDFLIAPTERSGST
jgi:hypothetical protein